MALIRSAPPRRAPPPTPSSCCGRLASAWAQDCGPSRPTISPSPTRSPYGTSIPGSAHAKVRHAAEAETIGPDILASARLWLVSMTVWVEFWQMQCCGEPFRLGDQVAWTVRATDTDWLEVMLGTHRQPGVDAVEDHHGGVPEGTAPTRGTVTRITAVHCRYAPRHGSDSHTI